MTARTPTKPKQPSADREKEPRSARPTAERDREQRSARPTAEREREPRSARPNTEETTFSRAAARSPARRPTAALNLGASSKELGQIVKTLGRIDKEDIAVGELEVAEKDLPDRPPIVPEPFPFVVDRKCITFVGRVGDEDVNAYFCMRNTSLMPYLFKLKASNNDLFRFTPVCGIVTAEEEAECTVIFSGQLTPDVYTEWISIHVMSVDIEHPNILTAFGLRHNYISRLKVFCDFAYAEDGDSHPYQRALEIHKGHSFLLKDIAAAYYNVWRKKEMDICKREDSVREKCFESRADRENAMEMWRKEKLEEKKGKKKEEEKKGKEAKKDDKKKPETKKVEKKQEKKDEKNKKK